MRMGRWASTTGPQAWHRDVTQRPAPHADDRNRLLSRGSMWSLEHIRTAILGRAWYRMFTVIAMVTMLQRRGFRCRQSHATVRPRDVRRPGRRWHRRAATRRRRNQGRSHRRGRHDPRRTMPARRHRGRRLDGRARLHRCPHPRRRSCRATSRRELRPHGRDDRSSPATAGRPRSISARRWRRSSRPASSINFATLIGHNTVRREVMGTANRDSDAWPSSTG